MPDKLWYLEDKPHKYWFDACKLLYHQDRLNRYMHGLRIPPITIDMGIHKSCNIKCVYCYGIKQQKGNAYIPRDVLLTLAREAGLVGVQSIAIIGDGEPTMNPALYDFVEALDDAGVQSAVATNGLLLDELKIRRLTRYCTWVRFNISGVQNYESVMGAPAGSYKKFEEMIHKAVEQGKKTGCTIGLQMVLIPECFEDVVPLAKKAIEWEVDYLVIKQFSDGGKGMPLHFNMDKYEEATNVLREAEKYSTDQTKIIVKWSALKDTIHITRDKHWEFDCCNDLPFLLQISGNGKCYPCGYHFGNPEYCYGDLLKQGLAQIITSDRYWEVIQKVKETPLDKLCTGQCRHTECLKFIDKLNKVYKGNLHEALVEMCGGTAQYCKLMDNPPVHTAFL